MSACYALRKDDRPCCNYARSGQKTCRVHANFFSDPKEWLEKTLWNCNAPAYKGICSHMQYALKERLIEIKPGHILKKRQHMGYCRSGVAYAIIIQYSPEIEPYHHSYLYWNAIQEFTSILRKYHDTFGESYTSTELTTMECKKILPREFTGRYFPLFWNSPRGMFWILLNEMRNLNRRFHWGVDENRPYGCAHVWKSLILNWLEYYKDCIEDEILFDEEFSKTPIEPEVHDRFLDIPYFQNYLASMEDAWGIWRKQKRETLLDSMRRKTDIYKEELMATTWHPDRFMSWCLDVEEKADMEAHWRLS